jgi:hypothetical protein
MGGRRSPVYCLDNGESESLRVVPATKKLNIVQLTNAATGAERMGNMINLHFEGNWMPIRVRRAVTRPDAPNASHILIYPAKRPDVFVEAMAI